MLETCRERYANLKKLIPAFQYYRYCDHWNFVTQRLVFSIALVVFLEKGFLVQRDTCAEILGLDEDQSKGGFHLDIECYLMGILQMASELVIKWNYNEILYLLIQFLIKILEPFCHKFSDAWRIQSATSNLKIRRRAKFWISLVELEK